MPHPGRGLHGQAVEELGRRIIRGDYAPGSVVDPVRFETELGVSKTVVREAMRVLASKGLSPGGPPAPPPTTTPSCGSPPSRSLSRPAGKERPATRSTPGGSPPGWAVAAPRTT
ncbi:FadR/GntR family transcriptional regulator [Streptomyces sp. NPDC002611]